MSIYSNIPEAEVKRYALSRKVTLLDAFRALLSQKLLDDLDDGRKTEVLRELVFQVIGEGVKAVPLVHVNGGKRDVLQEE